MDRLLRSLGLVLAMATAMQQPGCLVEQRCFSDADCEDGDICRAGGTCGPECTTDAECGASMQCSGRRCVPVSIGPLTCPDDMVNVADAFCVDRYEASRLDATQHAAGKDGAVATSRAGVLPWQVNSNQEAEAACIAAGKALCTPQQWKVACEGSVGTAYGYGETYQPTTCNGIDLYGLDGLRLLPTGSLAQCRSDWGAYDMNGNLWEHVAGGSPATVRGGAFNCIDSQALHRCDYIPGNWTPSALGFRCCSVGIGADAGSQPDGSVSEDVTLPDATADVESGCLVEDASDGPADVSMDPLPDAVDDAADAPEQGEAAAEASTDASSSCPADMVEVSGFCMDRYEASHADATAVWQGSSPVAASLAGVLPWFSVDLPMARAACVAAGKRLCRLDEWMEGCTGWGNKVYAYGNTYEPTRCNGIDTFCNCSSGACSGLSQCPYPHCFSMPSSEGPGPCGAQFHVLPTGAMPLCISIYGAYDINGNVWELADTNDGLEHFRGGAYNCGDSEALHRCDHDGTWGPSARGFRCCTEKAP